MPDFDKDLQPIIKPSELEIRPPLNPFEHKGFEGIEPLDGAGGMPGEDIGKGLWDYFSNMAKTQNPYRDPMMATFDQLSKAFPRYGEFSFDVPNLEEASAREQTWPEQFANASIKLGALTLGTFFQFFNALPKTATAAKEGSQLAGLDTYESDIDQFYDNMENWFPNYYLQETKDHPFKALFGAAPGFTNMWADRIFKNGGYMAGTIAGALVTDAALFYVTRGIGMAPVIASQLGRLSWAFSKIFTSTTRADLAIQRAIELGKSAKQIARIEDIYKASEGARLLNKARFGLNLWNASLTEGSVEARMGHKQLLEELVQEYRDNNYGFDPDEATLEGMKQEAEAAMNTRLGINIALLMVSNTIQWDNMLRPFNSAQWGWKSSLSKSIENSLGRIALKEGSLDVFENVVAKGFKNTLIAGASRAFPSIVSEGLFEEGLQFATERGVSDYFHKRYNAKQSASAKEAWDSTSQAFNSVIKGLEEQFGTTEGLESMFAGAVLGGLGSGVRGAFASKEERNTNNRRVEMLNAFPLTGIIDNKINEAITTAEIKKGMIDAVANNNVFEYKNLKFKEFFNFIQSGLFTNRFNLRIEQLKALKELKPEEFKGLFGIDFDLENKKLVSDYVDNLLSKAEEIKSNYESIEATFSSNPFNKVSVPRTPAQSEENQKHDTFNNWKIELTYQLSLAQDSKRRMGQIEQDLNGIVPVTRDTLLALGLPSQAKTPEARAAEIIDTISKEGGMQVPKQKEAFVLKMVQDYNALDKREKKASNMYDYLSDPKGTFKYFEDSKKAFEEMFKDVLTEKEKHTVKTKDGDFQFEVGEDYIATSAKDRKKQDSLFGEKAQFTFLGVTEDGKLSISLKNSGQTINVTPEDISDMAFASSIETSKTDNARLFVELADKTLLYQITKDGDPLTGFLEYDSYNNKLSFRTVDGKKVFTVTRDQFIGKDDSPAQISLYEGSLSKTATDIVSVPVTETEILNKFEQKNKVMAEAMQEASERQKQVAKELESARNNLNQVLKALNDAMLTKTGKPRKTFTNDMRKTISNLTQARDTWQNTVVELEQEKEELDNVVSYLQNLMDYKETVSENFDEMFDEVAQDMRKLKEVIDFTEDGIKQGNKLIEDITDAITTSFKMLKDYIAKMKEQNPEVPFFAEQLQELVDKFLSGEGLPAFKSSRDTFTKLLTDFQDQVDGLGDTIKSIPNMLSRVEKLMEQVEELQQGLSELQRLQKEKAPTLRAFEGLAKSYEKRVKQELKFRNNAQLLSEILGTMYGGLQSAVRSRKEYDPDTKKSDEVIPNATIVPSQEFSSMALEEHHVRANFFGANFYNIEDVDRVKAIIVTKKNQAAAGVPGLIENLVGEIAQFEALYPQLVEALNIKVRKAIEDGTIDQQATFPYENKTWRELYEQERIGLEKKRALKVDPDKVIALVFVKESADGKSRTFIDANGNAIVGQVTPKNAVYQVMPLEDLTWSNGVSMFRKNTPESTQKRIRDRYAMWRTSMLESPPTRTFSIQPSAGHLRFQPLLDASGKAIKGENLTVQELFEMYSVMQSGFVTVTEKRNDFTKGNLIFINTTNTNVTKGFTSYTAKLGSVFLNLANKYVPLYGRKLTENEAITMYKVIKRFAELADQNKLKSPEAQRLVNWLRSIVYWGVPLKQPADNSVWFEKVPSGGLNLFVGKDRIAFPFTPEGLENNRDQIIGALRNVYNNVNASMASDTSYAERYEEITDIDEQGQPVVRTVMGKPYWPNYQTYLLSDKGRTKEEIPFKTIAKPASGTQWSANAEGVYFVIQDNEFKFDTGTPSKNVVRPGSPKRPGTPPTPPGQKPSTPPPGPKGPVLQTGKITPNGKTHNAFNLDGEDTIYFVFDSSTDEVELVENSQFTQAIKKKAKRDYGKVGAAEIDKTMESVEKTILAYIQAVEAREAAKKKGTPPTPPASVETDRAAAEQKLKEIWNSIGNNPGRNALEEGWAESFGYLNETLAVGGENYQAHGMGKSGFAYAIRDLFELFNKGIAADRGGGQLYTAPLAISEENKAAASALGTAGGTAYTDGAFVLVAKKGIIGIKSINDIGGILVNSGLIDIKPEILTELRKAFPGLVIESYKNSKGLVEQLNKKAEVEALEGKPEAPAAKRGFKLSVDKKKKDQGKADLANALISYPNPGTSSFQYVQDATKQGIPVNEQIKAGPGVVAMVSVNGNNKATDKQIEDTYLLAREIIETGGTVVMDSTADANRSWNASGEALVQEQLGTPYGQTSKGYNYWGPNPEEPLPSAAGPELTTSTGSVMPNAGGVQATDEDVRNLDKELDNLDETGDPVLREKVDYIVQRFERENWNKVEAWLKENFPNVPVYRVKNLLRSLDGRKEAWGMYKDGAIYVYEGAEEGTLYHEVFESVWKSILTPEERAQVAKEFRARSGSFQDRVTLEDIEYKNATDDQLKEKLAEEFREIRLAEDEKSALKKVKGFIGKMFKELLDIIRTFFVGPRAQANTEKLFNRIGTGYYKSFVPFESQLSFAKMGYINIEQAMITTGAELRVPGLSQNQVHDIVQSMTYYTINQLIRENRSLFIYESVNKAEIYENIQASLRADLLRPVKVAIAKYGKDNEEVKRLKEDTYNFIATIKNVQPLLNKIYEDNLKTYGVEFDEEENAVLTDDELAKRDDWADQTLIDNYRKMGSTMRLFLSTIPRVDENGNMIRSSVNGPLLIPTIEAYMAIMNKVHMATNPEDMLKRLREMAMVDPNYRPVYNRLTNSDYSDEAINWDGMNQHNVKLITAFYTVFKKQQPDYKNLYILAEGAVQVGQANFSNLVSQFVDDMESSLNMAVRKEGSMFIYDSKIRGFRLDNRLDVVGPRTIQERVDFLSGLGINFLMEDLQKLNPNSRYLSKFVNATDGLFLSIVQAERIVSIDKKVFKISTRLKELAEVKAYLKNPEFSSTFYGLSGQRKQSFLGPNAVSDLYYYLNNVNNISELANTPYAFLYTKTDSGDALAKYSVYLDKIFDENGNKRQGAAEILKFSIAEGTSNDVTGRKKESSRQTFSDRLVQEINMNLEGYHYILVPGDATIEAMIYTGTGGFQAVTKKDMLSGFAVINEIFGGYFKAEVEVARQTDRNIVSKGGRKATDLRFFKNILSPELHQEVVEYFTENKELTPEDVYENFKPRIESAVKSFIEDRADNTFRVLREYQLINERKDEAALVKARKEKTVSVKDMMWDAPFINFEDGARMSYETLMLNILTREANYVINNIELHKLLFSDPYQYSDELKRIKNALSPKKAIVADSPSLNSTFNRVWNEGYEEEDDLGYTDFNRDYFNTITVEDVLSYTSLPGYDPFEKTDGAGMIIFKAHRNARIREGNWNDDEEQQYRYDVAWEKRDKGKSLSASEKKLLEKNPNVASAYTPSKPLAFGGVIENNNYNNVVLDKFALYPLSYRVLREFDIARGVESNIVKFYNKMQAENIDYAVFQSGRKVGAKQLHKVYDGGKFNEAAFTPEQMLKVPFSKFYIQADVPSKDEEVVTRGSQATKLVTLDLMEAGVPKDFMPEEKDFNKRYLAWNKEKDKETVSPLYKEIKNNERLLKELTLDGYNNLLKRLGIKELAGKRYEIADPKMFADTIRSEIKKREVNSNIIETLDDLENQSIVAEASPAYQQIRNILFSIVDKQVIKPFISGGMKVQIPNVMFEAGDVKVETINGKLTHTSNELTMYQEGGETVMEVYLSRWFKTSLSDKELMDYLNKPENQHILKGLAYRIPTQRQNSIDRIKVKRLLPASFKDVVVVPEALVKKAGSDFDIDKLTMYLKNVYINNEGYPVAVPFVGFGEIGKAKLRQMFEAGEFVSKKDVDLMSEEKKQELDRIIEEERSDFEDNSFGKLLSAIFGDSMEKEITTEFIVSTTGKKLKERIIDALYSKSLQNAYIESMENLVTSKENNKALLSPNSSDQLKQISKDVYKKLGFQEVDYTSTGNMLDSVFMARLRHFFVTGKYAIGIAAVNQTNQSLVQRTLVYIDKNKIKNQPMEDRVWLGDGSILLPHNQIDKDGELVATLSMVNNMERSEDYPEGQAISDLVSQFIDGYVDISKGPWIMELGASPNVASTFLFLIKMGVPIKTVSYFMNQPIIRDYLKAIETSGYSWLFIDDIVSDVVFDGKYRTKNNPIDSMKFWADQLDEQNKKTPLMPTEDQLWENIGTDSFDNEGKLQQQFVLKEFLKYAKMASQLFAFTQGTNFDTSNFNDPYLVFRKMMQRQKAQQGIISSVEDVLDNSFIGDLADKIVNSRDALAEILSSDKGVVRNTVQKILARYVDMSDREFVGVARRVVADLFDWAVQTSDKTRLNQALSDLLKGEDSLAFEMEEFMNEVRSNPSHPLHNNAIVKDEGFLKVFPSPRVDGPINMKGTNKDNKVYDQNQIIYSFRELRDYLGATSSLYINLVNLAVLQSGVTNSPISFTNLLPYEDFKNIYADVLKDLSQEDLNSFYEADSFERNNWANEDVIPHTTAGYVFTMMDIVYNAGREFLPEDVRVAMAKKKLPELMSFSALSQAGRADFVSHSWNNLSYTTAERERMRKEGDYSYINRGLYKKVYKQDGTPLTHISKTGKIYYIYKMINAWGDSFRAKEFYREDRQSVFNNGYLKSFEMDNRVIASYFGVAQNIALPGMKPMAMAAENVAKLESGQKTTTVRSIKEFNNIGIEPLETAQKIIGDKVYMVTNRGFLTIDEAGGVEAIAKSEGWPTTRTESNTFPVKVGDTTYYTGYNQTKMWAEGTGKLYVYDIRPATKIKVLQDVKMEDIIEYLPTEGEKSFADRSDNNIKLTAAFSYLRNQFGADILTDQEIIDYLKLNCS